MLSSTKTTFGVIFDVDGVLINSETVSEYVTRELLAEYGIDFNELIDPTGQNHIGGSAKEMFKLIKEQFDVNIDEDEFMGKRTIRMQRALKDNDIKAEIGLDELLTELKENSAKIAVATAGVESTTHVKLDIVGLKHHFNVVVTANDVKNHKPHPDVYLTAAQKLNISPVKCIAIEDSLRGMQAARSAGMKVVAFLKHSDLKHDLVNADLIVHKWEDLNYNVLRDLSQSKIS